MDGYAQTAHEAEHDSAITDDRRDGMAADGRMLTTRGLASMMGVSVATAARWCREGEVESWRCGPRGHHRIPVRSLDPATLVRLYFPKRLRDFFKETDGLTQGLERVA